MFSYKLYSHPDKLLKDHLYNVRDIGLNVFEKEGLKNILQEEVLEAILLFHDFGKASIYFQDKLFEREEHNINLTYHSDISALACLFYLEKQGFSIKDSGLAFLTIKKHHGNFNDNLENLFRIDEHRLDYLEKILEHIDFVEIEAIYNNQLSIKGWSDYLKSKIQSYRIRKYRKEFFKKLSSGFDFYTRLNLYFSILVYSDKQDCIFNRDMYNAVQPELKNYQAVDLFKAEIFNHKIGNTINEIREKSYHEVENNLNTRDKIFSINLPTGAGKTLTALNAGLKLLEKDKKMKRIIYCLPFTSIIDQNAAIFQKVLKTDDHSILLKHHHLSELNYSAAFYEDEIFKDHQAENLIESWESRVIVTTFFQLLHSFLTGSNRLLKKLNKIPNSIIILDEVQSIPRKYWLLINRYFKYLTEALHIKLILVTATMPLIFSEQDHEIVELAKSKKDYFNFFNRISLDLTHIKNNRKVDISSFCTVLYQEIIDNEKMDFLIILNTINSSLSIYDFLIEKGLEIIYLSSNIVPRHRLERITKIKKSKKRCIVVSTQVIEAGVDIDFDIVYRDFAPLDSIFQACGRCNRNGINEHQGRVKVIRLINENGKEYSSFIYDSVNLSRTLSLFEERSVIYENDFFNISFLYFNEMKKVTETNTSSQLISAIENLNYKDAFYSQNSFQLIEEKFSSQSVFVEIDEEATRLFEAYKLLSKEIHSFEQRVKMKKLFNQMSHYMINVPKKLIRESEEHSIFFVSHDMLPTYYHPLTGFIRDSQEQDFFF